MAPRPTAEPALARIKPRREPQDVSDCDIKKREEVMRKRPKERGKFQKFVATGRKNQIFWRKRRKNERGVSIKLRETAQRKPVGRRSFLEAPVRGLNSPKTAGVLAGVADFR